MENIDYCIVLIAKTLGFEEKKYASKQAAQSLADIPQKSVELHGS